MARNETLSPGQHTLLAIAARREDGAVDPLNLGDRRASRRSANALIDRHLLREVRTEHSMPIWRESDEGRPLSLIVTKAGREAFLALADKRSETPAPVIRQDATKHVDDHHSLREGTKIASVIAMLSRDTGATLQTLTDATGWQPHTIRAAITGVRKQGYVVSRQRGDDGISVYRIPELHLELEI